MSEGFIIEFTFVICPKCTCHINTNDLDRHEGYCPVCGKQLCTYNTREKVILT
jgi:uncharacterized paraquat-inducible protein A